MSRGLLFVISGPSGAGKGTICQRLKEQGVIELSVSMTTRKPRPGEIDGQNYYFVSQEEFIENIGRDGFLEYAQVYGNYYGTPRDIVLKKLEQSKDVVLEIDIQGALKVKETYPRGVFIFVLPPSMAELRRRITGRGSETEADINLRMGETLKEVSYIDRYDYCVINDDIEEAVQRVSDIIKAEHSKVTQDIYELIAKYKEEI
jgi:guanylate kinase